MPDSRNVLARIRSGQLKKFSIYVDARLHRAIKALAAERGVSLQSLIQEVLSAEFRPTPRREHS